MHLNYTWNTFFFYCRSSYADMLHDRERVSQHWFWVGFIYRSVIVCQCLRSPPIECLHIVKRNFIYFAMPVSWLRKGTVEMHFNCLICRPVFFYSELSSRRYGSSRCELQFEVPVNVLNVSKDNVCMNRSISIITNQTSSNSSYNDALKLWR